MKRISTLGLALGLGFALAGTASAQVKFGMAGPITGPSAATGAQMKNGVDQAAEDINKTGGILGQKITVEYGDDVSDPKQGVSVANKFAGDGVKFVIGNYNSGVTIPSSEVYQENGILEITPASTNPTVTERKMWNIFRVCGRDDQQGKVAGTYILKHFKGKKIAVVHDKTTYGKGLADEMKKAINAGGIKEVLYEGINTGEKDYSALVSKIKQSGADLVYFGGLYTEGGLIVRQMRDQGVKAPLMGGDGITSDEFASVGGPGVEGTLMTYGPDPRHKPEAKKVVAEFRAKKFEPEAYTLYSYAGVQVIKQAAEAAKSLDPKKVAEKMHSGMKFKTVLGDLAFDKKGDITKLDYVMYLWKKDASGKITYVECPGSDCCENEVGGAPVNRGHGPGSNAGAFFRGAKRSSADPAERRKRLQQPHAHLVDAAGEEGDAGEHQKRAHRLLDAMQIILEAREKCRERLDGEGGDHERNAEAERIDRQQAGALGDRLLGRRHRQNGGEDRPDAGRPAEGKGQADHVGAPQPHGLGHLQPLLPVQQRDRRDAEEVQAHDDDDDAGDGR